jgi:hypothetical protein
MIKTVCRTLATHLCDQWHRIAPSYPPNKCPTSLRSMLLHRGLRRCQTQTRITGNVFPHANAGTARRRITVHGTYPRTRLFPQISSPQCAPLSYVMFRSQAQPWPCSLSPCFIQTNGKPLSLVRASGDKVPSPFLMPSHHDQHTTSQLPQIPGYQLLVSTKRNRP